MDLLTVILACSLHPDDRLVEAFIRKVSGANPLFVGDYVSLETHDDLTSTDQVLELAASISEKGGRPALGLMAIPISWAARFNRTPMDLLDACTNVSIGTAMMASFAADCGPRRQRGRGRLSNHPGARRLEAARSCVLQRFEREVGVQGFTKVESEIGRLPTRDPDLDLPPERSNVFDADSPAARPQMPLESPGSSIGGAPPPARPAPPRPSRSRSPAAAIPPPGPEGPRSSALPPNPPAPTPPPRGAAEETPASRPAPPAPPPQARRLPTAVGPGRP